MIELFSIFLIFLSLFFFSLFPFKINFINNSSIFYKFNIFDLLSLNLIINITFILIISFFKFNLTHYFILIISLSLIFNFYFYINIKKYFSNLFKKKILYFFLLNFIIAIYLTSNPILAWDGLENWYFKAQNFFYNYNFFDLKDLKVNNNYYPHLGTLLWGIFWKNSFLQFEYLGRLIFVYIYLLSIFSLCELINNNKLKVIILSLIVLLCFDDFLFRGYQEILIFSLFIIISKNFYFYFINKKFINLLICFICLNLIPWVKHEGFLFAFIFSFSILFFIKNLSNKFEIVSLILLTWILIILKNFLFYKYLELNIVHGGGLNFIDEFASLFEFILIFSKGFFIAIFKYKIWILIILSFYISFKIKNLNKIDKLFLNFLRVNLYLFFVLILAIYFNLYVNSNINFNWWIDNSLDRLAYSISGIFIIKLIIILNYFRNYSLK